MADRDQAPGDLPARLQRGRRHLPVPARRRVEAVRRGARDASSGLSGGNRTLSVTVTDRGREHRPVGGVRAVRGALQPDQGQELEEEEGQGLLRRATSWRPARPAPGSSSVPRTSGSSGVIAPAGPKLGKIRVRTGTGFWKTYDLSKGKATKSRYIDVRDAASAAVLRPDPHRVPQPGQAGPGRRPGLPAELTSTRPGQATRAVPPGGGTALEALLGGTVRRGSR